MLITRGPLGADLFMGINDKRRITLSKNFIAQGVLVRVGGNRYNTEIVTLVFIVPSKFPLKFAPYNLKLERSVYLLTT